MKHFDVCLHRAMLCLALLGGYVAAMAGTPLPTLYVTTADGTGITSRQEWKEHTRLRLVLPDGTVGYESSEASVRGRGHSSFAKPKRPFNLKLEKKAALLGMAPHKRWALLANFMDHSLIRNSLAFAIARQTSLEWTPHGEFVEVVLNGVPQGCYLLCESVRVHPDRVDIDEEEGCLIELDVYDEQECCFRTRYRQLPVHLKSPENPSPARIDSLQRFMNRIEEMLYATPPSEADMEELYDNYMDLDTFADWWLVHELTQNAEPNGPRSCYMYLDKGERLKAGPVWDFDLAFIDVGLDSGGDLRPARLNRTDVRRLNGDSLYNSRALWYDRLLEDPTFRTRVQQRWQLLEPRFRALLPLIDRWQAQLEPSALADEQLWGGQDPARFDTCTTFRSAIAQVRQTYARRIERLHHLLTPSDRRENSVFLPVKCDSASVTRKKR